MQQLRSPMLALDDRRSAGCHSEISLYLLLMPSKKPTTEVPARVQEWILPAAATLGSSVRARGILLEIRAKLGSALKKAVDIRGSTLILSMPEDAEREFRAASATISKNLEGIESLAVIPREIQDILSISTTERHRWLKDGRLPSAGTRTVKLRGRARKITFHVFDPRTVEDVLDQDLVSAWREEDVITAAENRRRAVWKAKLAREQKRQAEAKPDDGLGESSRPNLVGWAEFERDGPLS